MKSSYKYVILTYGCLFVGLLYMSMSAWGMSVGELQKTFNLSSAAIMWGNGALVAGFAIGNFLSGSAIAKMGWRPVFNFVMLISIIATFLIPNVQSYALIVGLRFVMGCGVCYIAVMIIVASWFPTKERGLAIGFLSGAIAAGVAVGALLTAYTTPLYGWKFNFYMMGVMLLVASVLYNFIMKLPSEDVEGGTVASKEEILITIPEGKSIYGQPVMLLLGLGMFCVMFYVYGMYSFMANYLFSLGYTVAQVGTLAFWNGLIGVVSTPFGGWFSDVFVRRGIHPIKARAYSMSVVAFGVAAVGALIMPLMAPLSFGAALVAILLTGWGCPAANGPICALPADIFGAKKAGEGLGFIVLVAGIGGVMSPSLVSYIATTAGWTVGWYVVTASAVVGILISLVTPSLSLPKNNTSTQTYQAN